MKLSPCVFIKMLFPLPEPAYSRTEECALHSIHTTKTRVTLAVETWPSFILGPQSHLLPYQRITSVSQGTHRASVGNL